MGWLAVHRDVVTCHSRAGALATRRSPLAAGRWPLAADRSPLVQLRPAHTDSYTYIVHVCVVLLGTDISDVYL